MKKVICGILILSMLLSGMLISCGNTEKQTPEGEGQQGESTDVEETTAVTQSELETVDLNGFELRILNYDNSWFNWANTVIDVEELVGEPLNDVIYNRTAEVEQKFNATITETRVGATTDVLAQIVLAGDDLYDMTMVFTANLLTMFTSGYLSPWNNLSAVDLTDGWWDADAAALYNFSGQQIATSGDYSLYNYSTRHCYVFNKDMYTDLNPGYDLYSLVKEGAWTLDKLYEIAALAVNDLNGDSQYTNDDRYGISGSVTRHYSALLAGAGIKYVDKNADGELYFAIPGNEYALNAIQKIVSLNTGNQIFYNGVNDIGGNTPSLFKERHTLFTAAYINEVSELRDMDDEIGILPAPKLTEEQDRYYSLVEGGAVSVIPRTVSADRYENVGILLNALAYYSSEDVIPTYIDVILKSKVSRDEESAAMLDLIFSTSINDLGTEVWSAELKNQYTARIFLPRSEDVASVTASIEKAANAQIKRFTNAVSEMVQ